MSKYGIKETQEVVVAVVKAVYAVKGALADGKIGITDLGLVLPLIDAINPAIRDAQMIPLELADLQPGEYDQLVAALAPIVRDLAPDQVEILIFGALKLVKQVLELVGLVK